MRHECEAFALRGLGCLLLLSALAGPVIGQEKPEDAEDETAETTGGEATTAPGQSATYADRITVTATGEEETVDELPISVTVLTREEIESSQEESVADLVRRVPGVTVMQAGDSGGAASFFVRGTESDHVLALFDGVRLNSPYFAGYDWSLASSAGIERIEVARGPFSALWGSDAIGGVVNVIPGRGSDGSRVVVVGEAGDDDWQRLEATFGWGDERWDVYASVFDREGESDLVNSDFSNRQWLFDAGYSWGSGQRVALLYQDFDSELGIPFSDPLTPTPNRRQDTEQELIAAPMRFQPVPGWALEVTPSRVERVLEFRDPDDPFGFVESDVLADTDQFRLASRHDFGAAARHELSWGGEWREDEVFARSNFGVDLDRETVRLRGLFAQDVWRASDRTTVIGGLRFDETDEWGSELSPKVSVGHRATEILELRASYGEAFRQPSVGELFFPGSGNPLLEPERSKSAELGIAVRAGRNRIEAAWFATDTEDLIDFELVTFTFANIEQVEIRGVEASWSRPVLGALESSVQATWLDTEDQDGLPLARRPEWSGSWTLSGRVGERLRGDLATFYVGERPDVDAVTFGPEQVGGFVTANLAVAYEVIGGLEITARVTNLADREYAEIDGFPAPGRRLVAGLRWTK